MDDTKKDEEKKPKEQRRRRRKQKRSRGIPLKIKQYVLKQNIVTKGASHGMLRSQKNRKFMTLTESSKGQSMEIFRS